MSGPMDREVARFLAAVRGKMSAEAIRRTAYELADKLTGNGDDQDALWVLRLVLEKGAAAVKRDGDV